MVHYSKIRMIHRRPDDIILLIISVIVFILFAFVASSKKITQLEIDTFNAVNGINFNIGLPLTIIMISGTIFGVLIIAAVAYIARKKRISFDLLLTGGAAWIFSHLLKILVARERPVALLEPILRETTAVGFAFPSGHTTIVTAMAIVLTPHIKKKYRKYIWLFVLVIGLGRIYLGVHFPTDVIGGFFLGAFIGLSVRLIRGTKGYKPSEKTIKESLKNSGIHVKSIKFLKSDARSSLPFIIRTADSKEYFMKISSPENFKNDILRKTLKKIIYAPSYRSYPFVTNLQKIEHEAYLNILAQNVGVKVPRFIATVELEDGGIAFVQEKISGISLDKLDKKEISDNLLYQIWNQVKILQKNNIAHRDLGLANFVLDKNGCIWLIDFGFAQTSANAYLKGLDIAEILIATANATGVDRAVDAALHIMDKDALANALPYLQTFGLTMRTLQASWNQNHIISQVKSDLAKSLKIQEVKPEKITRFKIKNILILLIFLFAIHFLLPQIEELPKTIAVVKQASLSLIILAALIQAITFIFDSTALQSVTTKKLKILETYLVQIAGSFLNAFNLKGIGIAVLNQRYLVKKGETEASALSCVATVFIGKYILRFVLFLLLIPLLKFMEVSLSLNLSKELHIVLIVLLILIVLGIINLAVFPKFTKNITIYPLKNFAQRYFNNLKSVFISDPKRFSILFGSQLISIIGDALTMYLCLLALNNSTNFFAVFAVLIAGTLISSISPTPGGLGAIESSLIIGLTSLGVAASVAVVAVLAYRLLTFWLPIIPGIFIYRNIKRNQII
jgi:uncharacterized protein (TIRG00374 family)